MILKRIAWPCKISVYMVNDKNNCDFRKGIRNVRSRFVFTIRPSAVLISLQFLCKSRTIDSLLSYLIRETYGTSWDIYGNGSDRTKILFD